MPQDGLAILLICITHLVPFSTAYACCTFHPSDWSTRTPRYFVELAGVICLCRSCSAVLVLLLLLCTKSIRASLEYSSGELWIVDQSDTLPSLHIMSASLSCASVKLSTMAIMMVLST